MDFKIKSQVYLKQGTLCVKHGSFTCMFDYKYYPFSGEMVIFSSNLDSFLEELQKAFPSVKSFKFQKNED